MHNTEFKNAEIISWILLSISIASQSSPTTFEGIMQIADGINHAVPTQKEMQTSISWLIANDLILKDGKKYSLSENGVAFGIICFAFSRSLGCQILIIDLL